MLRHCPIPRFSSASPRRKMTKSSGKEKAPKALPESQALELADPKDVTKEPIPPQKVLKIFSINIIAQSLPFCRRRAWYRQLFLKRPPGNELEFSRQSTWVHIGFLFRFCFAIW
ncbi:hypothetical protein QQF64_001230, partial [Cirrhinus molitorella]